MRVKSTPPRETPLPRQLANSLINLIFYKVADETRTSISGMCKSQRYGILRQKIVDLMSNQYQIATKFR